MKIRRYTSRDMRGAMERVKKDMGADAVILETRRVRQKGLLGFFKKRLVEVTASVDNSQKSDAQGKRMDALPFKLEEAYNKRMESEIRELKKLVEQMVNSQGEKGEGSTPLDYLYQRLLENEIEEGIARQLTGEIQKDFPGNNLTEEQAYRLINDKIGRRLKFNNISDNRQVYCFVGPTGVGKTTTLAKMAANFSVFKEKDVGLITIDNYRVGAVEQLRNYAHLIDIPLEVVMSPGELKKALKKMKDKEVVLIDTAGRSSNNSIHINELKAFTDALPQANVFLVLSMTTKSKDLVKITENFKPARYNSLIFTKLDETDTYGSIFNIAHHTTLPVALITTGQKVPEDFEIATEERLTSLILGVGL